MSLIHCFFNAEGRYNICCSECCAIVCQDATLAEVAEYSRADVKVLCFDCDVNEADTIPVNLVEFCTTWLLGIADVVMLAEWLGDADNFHPKHIKLSKISLTTYFDLKTGLGPIYTPLSSSLYLNRKSQKPVGFLGDR